MPSKWIVSTLTFGLALTSLGGQSLAPGDMAPEFYLPSVEGKRLTLKDLRGEGIVFLYFVREGDAVNNEAMKMIHKIILSYYPNDHAKFFGVINADMSRARSWMAEHNPPYKLILDPKLELVYKYKIESSPAIVEVDAKGRIVKEWQGFSGYWLKDLNGFLAKATKRKLQQFDFSKTPVVTQYGIPYRAN